MRIIDGFVLRPIGSEWMVIGEGRKLINFSSLFSLNDSAALMWRSAEGRDFTPADLAAVLQENYPIDGETALQDATEMVEEWVAAGLVEE